MGDDRTKITNIAERPVIVTAAECTAAGVVVTAVLGLSSIGPGVLVDVDIFVSCHMIWPPGTCNAVSGA